MHWYLCLWGYNDSEWATELSLKHLNYGCHLVFPLTLETSSSNSDPVMLGPTMSKSVL